MKFYLEIFEQLSRAGEEIDRNSPISARLVIILVDNVFEILFYYHVQDFFDEENLLLIPKSEVKYPIKKRQNILHYFPAKIELIKTEKLLSISKDYYSNIAICHKFRNETYHKNRMSDEIIIGISRTYFQICCELLATLLPKCLTVTYNQTELDSFVELGFDKKEIVSPGLLKSSTIQKWVDIIIVDRKCDVDDFSKKMSEYLCNRISKLIRRMNFIDSRGNDESFEINDGTKKALKFVQFLQDDHPFPVSQKKYDRIFDSFEAKFRIEQIIEWMEIAKRIENDKTISEILCHFNKIDHDLHEIEEMTDQFASLIESQIENEVDRLRGN
jgi:hypothetical protein